MKFLNQDGVAHLWSLIKTHVSGVKTELESTISTGLATKQDTLVSGTSIKTINNESVLGSGNISIDLTLYKVVTSLPTADIDSNKIYLVANSTAGDANTYIEYIYVNSSWEKLGEYKAEVDLTPYAKSADVDAALALKADKSDTYTKAEVDKKVSDSGTFDSTQYYTKTEVNAIETALKAVATADANGMMSSTDYTKLAGIEEGATKTVVDSALDSSSTNPVENKAVQAALATKVDAVSGKGLSTNDYTTTEKTKLAGIAEGAEANVIEIVKVDGTALTVTDKAVNIDLSGKVDKVTGKSLSTNDFTDEYKAKLEAIATAATADEALTDTEIDEVCK